MRTLVTAARVLARPLLSVLPEESRKEYGRRLCRRISKLARDRYEGYRFDGGMIYLNLKESEMMAARALGLYEEHKHRALGRLLKPGMTFVDVGANKGDFSLLAARLVAERGRVIAVEPEAGNCEWLRKSIQLNGYRNISVCELALSDFDGEAVLHLGTKSGFHSLKPGLPERQRASVRVKTARLDSLLAALGCERVDGIKIDVEGAELEVLRGAEATLSANPDAFVLIDLHPHLGADLPAIETYLIERGFRLYPMNEPKRRLEHLPSVSSDVIAARNSSLLAAV